MLELSNLTTSLSPSTPWTEGNYGDYHFQASIRENPHIDNLNQGRIQILHVNIANNFICSYDEGWKRKAFGPDERLINELISKLEKLPASYPGY